MDRAGCSYVEHRELLYRRFFPHAFLSIFSVFSLSPHKCTRASITQWLRAEYETRWPGFVSWIYPLLAVWFVKIFSVFFPLSFLICEWDDCSSAALIGLVWGLSILAHVKLFSNETFWPLAQEQIWILIEASVAVNTLIKIVIIWLFHIFLYYYMGNDLVHLIRCCILSASTQLPKQRLSIYIIVERKSEWKNKWISFNISIYSCLCKVWFDLISSSLIFKSHTLLMFLWLISESCLTSFYMWLLCIVE